MTSTEELRGALRKGQKVRVTKTFEGPVYDTFDHGFSITDGLSVPYFRYADDKWEVEVIADPVVNWTPGDAFAYGCLLFHRGRELWFAFDSDGTSPAALTDEEVSKISTEDSFRLLFRDGEVVLDSKENPA